MDVHRSRDLSCSSLSDGAVRLKIYNTIKDLPEHLLLPISGSASNIVPFTSACDAAAPASAVSLAGLD